MQTDAKLDRPPPAIFIPQSSGVDAATQIEHGELFDFDFEVMPLLDVLVGRTLDQALSELGQVCFHRTLSRLSSAPTKLSICVTVRSNHLYSPIHFDFSICRNWNWTLCAVAEKNLKLCVLLS